MVSHRCAAWSAFGKKSQGIDAPFVRVKESINTKSMAVQNLHMRNEKQTFDVDQLNFKEVLGDGRVVMHSVDGKSLASASTQNENKVHSSVTKFTTNVDLSDPFVKGKFIDSLREEFKDAISIELITE